MSIKSLMHYAQICKSQGIFAWYDYGIPENLARYNSILPPLYEVGKIPVNVDLIWANNDKFSVKDVSYDLKLTTELNRCYFCRTSQFYIIICQMV